MSVSAGGESQATDPKDGIRTGRRQGSFERSTAETSVSIALQLDGTGTCSVSTGLPFFDHMLSQLSRHGRIDLQARVAGDLEVDAHHSVEDTGIALGRALGEAMGDRAGIRRFSSASIPLDEALVDVALDCSGRPYLYWDVPLAGRSPLGSPGFEPQLAEEFWRAVVQGAGLTLHVELRRGENTHHIIEAVFKSIARCLGDALALGGGGVPSTKGSLG